MRTSSYDGGRQISITMTGEEVERKKAKVKNNQLLSRKNWPQYVSGAAFKGTQTKRLKDGLGHKGHNNEQTLNREETNSQGRGEGELGGGELEKNHGGHKQKNRITKREEIERGRGKERN